MDRLRRPVNLVLDLDSIVKPECPDAIATTGHIATKYVEIEGDGPSRIEATSRRWNALQDRRRFDQHKTYLHFRERVLRANGNHVKSGLFESYLYHRRVQEMHHLFKVQDSKIFEGVSSWHITLAGEQAGKSQRFALREGWQQLLELFVPAKDQSDPVVEQSSICIMSNSYSETFVRWSLYAYIQAQAPDKPELLELINNIEIHANEIEGITRMLCSSGKISKRMTSSSDRERCLPAATLKETAGDFLLGVANMFKVEKKATPWLVYVGSSDIEYGCMRAADNGILLRGCGRTARTPCLFEECGFDPLRDFRSLKSVSDAGGHIVCMPSLVEVTQFLKGLVHRQAA